MLARNLITVAFVLLVLGMRALAAEIDEEDLRPGLVTALADPGGTAIVRLEPTIALALKTGEAAHPRLSADGGTIRWQGYVNILRAGDYRFSATVRGRLRLTAAGKEVLNAEVKEDKPALCEGPATALEAGVQPLTAEFTRLPGVARLELFWQSPFFRREPVPYDSLFHLQAKRPEKLAANEKLERGRFLFEEHSCIACHQAKPGDRLGNSLSSRKGPDLSQIGQRARVGWMYHWLADPQKLRPSATMPRLFGPGDIDQTQQYAVARYLESLGGPFKENPKPPNEKQVLTSRVQGRRLFASVGCVACHVSPEANGEQPPAVSTEGVTPAARQVQLVDLASKTTPEKLAEFLRNPLQIDPAGRMPNLLLQGNEALDLARFLCQGEQAFNLPEAPPEEKRLAAFRQLQPRPAEVGAFQRLPMDGQWIDLGKRVVLAKGCVNCHTINSGGKRLTGTVAEATFDDLKKRAATAAGCLTGDSNKKGTAPSFSLKDSERQALQAFLNEGANGAGSPAPAHAARVTLQRFNCLACHSRDGQGGLSPETVEELRRYEKAENAEAVTPPPLTDVGHKLRTPWLQQVLTQAGRARPWMGLRMPQFGPDNIGHLPEALAALEGTEPDSEVHQIALTPARIEAGRFLVGKNAFGCASCHDIAGFVSGGTRGPDLALMNQRVRYDWYLRWLEQAQRMQPGTRMPTVFPDGKSLIANVLAGHADNQGEAMWAYLSLGPTLPLPEGLEPPKGLVLTVDSRPVLVRTFMPEAGSRAVAVGYPGGLSVAFDAATARLAYAWSGNYLDVTPVWDGRGGSPAKLLGQRFWTAPPGCPWGLGDSEEPPDFTARAKDPAFGTPPPDGKIYDGPQRLQFLGYVTDPAGGPTFRYKIDELQVSERPEPLKSPVAAGLARNFTVKMPEGQTAWLLAGQTTGEPRLLDATGAPMPLDLKAERLNLPANGRLLILPQSSGRVLAIALSHNPERATWHLRRGNGSWQALLRMPAGADKEFALRLWSPYRDTPEFLKDLIPAR
jgi:mono/diheme cytochrome c family protein